MLSGIGNESDTIFVVGHCRLHMEIKDFYEYISPLPEEEIMRKDVVQRMSDLIVSIWPQAKVWNIIFSSITRYQINSVKNNSWQSFRLKQSQSVRRVKVWN